MRRAVPVIAATAGSLALLAGFHTSPSKSRSTFVAAGGSTTTAATAPTTTAPPTGSTPTTAAATRTIDGPDVSTRYGDVQVRVVLQGRRIVDVQPVNMPFDRDRSQRISDQAGPLLRSEALQAQSARINIISGATYTSDGYAQSLQGALDQM